MVLPLPPADGPGGMLYFEYADVGAGERHSLRLHVAQFDQAPVGPNNDYRYTGGGPVSPSESGILATFAAVGALWAAYYPPDWTLSLVDVWFNAGGRLTRLDVVPTAVPVVGVCADAEPAGVVQKRIFRVVAPNKSARRIYFSQVPGAQTWQNTPVSPTAGGVDARDQAWMAYLAGSTGGVVSGEGRRFLPDARLRVQWARRLVVPDPGVEPEPFDIFFGPTEPPPPPGAAFWVDSSAGTPPWRLWAWNPAAMAWQVVGAPDDDAAAGATLPPGVTGDLLVNVAGVWVRLPAGPLGDRLTMDLHGSVLLPTWLPDCCADTGKVIIPLPPSDQMVAAERCGAAVQMAAYLALYYSKVRTLLNAAAGLTFVLTLPLLADLIAGAAPTLLTAGTLLSVRQIIRLVIGLGLAGLRLSVAPVLSTAMQTAVRQAIYCALPLPPAPLDVTDDVRAHWCAALTANPLFTELSGPILALLSQIVTLAGWQTLANLGAAAPQTICATCGAGAAMQGGAQFGVGLTRAMQGGAEYGVRLTRAMQGGAQFGASLTGAMQGGAQTP